LWSSFIDVSIGSHWRIQISQASWILCRVDFF